MQNKYKRASCSRCNLRSSIFISKPQSKSTCEKGMLIYVNVIWLVSVKLSLLILVQSRIAIEIRRSWCGNAGVPNT